MAVAQGDVVLLQDPVAQELLSSKTPAQLAYTALDGTPRVVPIWFYWNGEELVFGTPPTAEKVKALQHRPAVAVSIDSDAWPYKVVQIRGTARVELTEISREYIESARRYFGREQGDAWVDQLRAMGQTKMARISVRPAWVAILDFVTRFPKAMS